MANSPEVLPLQLLQPLDANQQRSEPTPLGGEQRLVVTPDPGVMPADGDERGWRSSRLRIHRNGQVRSIWAVHLPGWQQLGWQLLATPAAPGDGASTAPEVRTAAGPSASEPLPTTEPAGVPNFQAMTKAQIINHCLSHYGVSLDGDRTKADLVATANALAAGEAPAAAEEPTGSDDANDDTNGDPNGAAATAEPELPPSQSGEEPGADLELPDDLL